LRLGYIDNADFNTNEAVGCIVGKRVRNTQGDT
jgi:hypothetical protein